MAVMTLSLILVLMLNDCKGYEKAGPGDYCVVIPKKTLLNPTDKATDNCNSITYCKIEKGLVYEKWIENICFLFDIPKGDCKIGKCKLRGWMIAIIVLIVLAVVGIGIGILFCVVC